MPDYERQPASEQAEGIDAVADIYIARGPHASETDAPSAELVAAIEHATPALRELFRRLLRLGFFASAIK